MPVNRRYVKQAVSGVLSRFYTFVVKYGWDDDLANETVRVVNELCQEKVITTDDLRNYLSEIGKKYVSPENQIGYYGTDVPKTVRLVMRDKVFYGRMNAVRAIIKEKVI